MTIKTVKWIFIALLVYVGSLFFREAQVPHWVLNCAIDRYAPKDLVVRVDEVKYGIRQGLTVSGLVVYDRTRKNPRVPLIAAQSINVDNLACRVTAVGLKFPRLGDSYYEPGNQERNERVEFWLPQLPRCSLVLIRPDILSVRASKVVADVECDGRCLSFERIHLDWPDQDVQMAVDGFCKLDLTRQEINGEVIGHAKQRNIRPMLEALDVPVAFPYFDAFTEVPGKVPARCTWKVNLVNSDFDMWLDLKPDMGKYNTVPMKRVEGVIHLCNRIRGEYLNYHQTIGPIRGVGAKGEDLEGTVIVDGTNGYNRVWVTAKSSLAPAYLLKIGGFEDEYISADVFGDSECELEFAFPRAMTNNYEVMNGRGHIVIRDGQLMRMRGFKGLLEAMPAIAPAVSWFSDSTQASCDYTIKDGVLQSDNIYIEGSLFSIKMYGQFDLARQKLNFNVHVQFTKNDSFMATVLHPLTWPFTKLLLEFRLTGAPGNPQWSYISVLDRVMEVGK